jgi:hypothetical protein
MARPRQAVKCARRLPADSKACVMPTLFRLLTVLSIVAALGYGAVWLLANYLEPAPRSITITIPQDRIGK